MRLKKIPKEEPVFTYDQLSERLRKRLGDNIERDVSVIADTLLELLGYLGGKDVDGQM